MRNIKSKTAKLRSPCMAIVFVMTLSMVLLLNSVQAASPAKTFPLDSQPFNKKYSQWSAEWWQFVLSFPVDINPNLDLTGGACGYGQHGPVWFLMGVFGATATRTCSIPEGKALFFPILNMVDINVTTQTPQELRAEIDPCMGAVTALLVEVDGVPIKTFEKLQKFRIKSKVFEATLPVNSLFAPDVAAGTYSPAVDDGFYVMLKPLSVGPHTIHFSGASNGCPFNPDPFALDVTYNITIVPVVK